MLFLKKKNMRLILFSFITILTHNLVAQMPSSIEMQFDPVNYKYSISGVGGLNLYNFNQGGQGASGQLSYDQNVSLKDKKGKIRTITFMIKMNPIKINNYLPSDTFQISKLAFTDNEYLGFFGLRYSKSGLLGLEQEHKYCLSPFLDFSGSRNTLLGSSNPLNTGFLNFNCNIGYNLGLIFSNEVGLISISISPQINSLFIRENFLGGNTLEEINKSSSNVGNMYLGFGGRFMVTFNDMNFFFDMRKYYVSDSKNTIDQLTQRAVLNFGAIATGTFLKSKVKK
jgi:hypothetical protein